MNNQNVSFFYNLVDTACSYIYEETKKNYLDSLIIVSEELTSNKEVIKLTKETREKIRLVYESIEEKDFVNEEIRLAMELLIVKGLKHVNYPLDILTPNTINYLFVIITSLLFKDNISILDTTLKTSTTIMCLCNNLKYEVEAIGIEENKRLVELAKCQAALESNMLKIYYQDYQKPVLDIVDLVIGNLEEHPWEIFVERLNNVRENGFFIYLINNDFFSDPRVAKIKQEIDKECTFLSLITLPKTLFQENQVGKSIIIGQKKVLKDYNINVVTIENFEKDTLNKAIEKIVLIIEEIQK